MNFIVGFLLIISDFDELGVFYMMQSLFSTTFANHLGIRGFFIENFPLLNYYLKVFDYYFNLTLPILYKHFQNLNIPYDTWVTKWFLTLFTICMPIQVTTRIWDCILTYGLNFIVQFTLVLLAHLETKLLEIDDEFDMLDFFKFMTPFTSLKNIEINLDVVLKEATNKKLDKNILKEIEKKYEVEIKMQLKMLDVKYEIKAFDNHSMSSCASKIDISQPSDSIEYISNNNYSYSSRKNSTRNELFNSAIFNCNLQYRAFGGFNIFGEEKVKSGSFISNKVETQKTPKINNSYVFLNKLLDKSDTNNKKSDETKYQTESMNDKKLKNFDSNIIKPIIMNDQEKVGSNLFTLKATTKLKIRTAKTSSFESSISTNEQFNKTNSKQSIYKTISETFED